MKVPGLIIVSAPSGAGKSTLCQRLIQEHPEFFEFSISSTTRPPRGQEKHGREYYFLSETEFKAGIKKEEFAEWAEVHGRFYGTSKVSLESSFSRNHSVILDIDVQGAASLRKSFPDHHLSIFIAPPNLTELEKRLKGRGTEAKSQLEQRMKNAKSEMARMNEFDAIIINDELHKAYSKFKACVLKATGYGST